jgi:hypothetical protein
VGGRRAGMSRPVEGYNVIYRHPPPDRSQ